MRVLGACILAAALWAAPVAAQRGTPPRATPPAADTLGSGLLLAVDCDSDCGHRSYWIVRQGDRVRLAAEGPGLLVPRPDGFWWLGFVPGSPPDPGAASGDGSRPLADTTGARPDTAASARQSAGSGGVSALVWAARPGVNGAAPLLRTDTLGSGWEVDLDWVGTDWIAVTEAETEGFQHARYYYDVLPFPGLRRRTSDAPGSGNFDPSGLAWTRALADCPRQRGAGEPEPELGWGVSRLATRWRLESLPRQYFAGDDEPPRCGMPPALAAPVLGYDRVSMPWRAIKDVLPGARTAFESPPGDLLLVSQDGWLYAFFPRGGAPGRLVARFAVPGRPILAQWAVGAHARRWTRELSELLQQGPPEVR